MVVTNGRLVLVAHYDPAERGPQKYETMSRFVAAFAAE
jgi:hypothetical protein